MILQFNDQYPLKKHIKQILHFFPNMQQLIFFGPKPIEFSYLLSVLSLNWFTWHVSKDWRKEVGLKKKGKN